MYKEKYIKYKNKYNFLKKQIGGVNFKINNGYEQQIDEWLNDENIIDKLIKEPQLVYFSVNDVIYKNDMMVDWIDSSIVKYYPMSFRQTDNNIKYKLKKSNFI